MSYAEQKWVADRINKEIRKSNLGKDMYIAGIPRGSAIRYSIDCNRNSTNLLDIHGSGGIISAVASCKRTDFYSESGGTIKMILDEEQEITLGTLATASTSGTGSYNSSINTDVSVLFSDMQDLKSDLINPNVTNNIPLLFNHRFQIVSTSSYGSSNPRTMNVVYALFKK